MLDQAILSDGTVVATVKSVRAEDLGDGFGSTVILAVTDTLVGSTAPASARLRQRSGTVRGESVLFPNDFASGDSRAYLVSLSRGAYDDDATTSGGTTVVKANGRPRFYEAIGTRYVVDGDTATPLFGTAQATSVSAAKATLSPLAKVRAAQSLNEPVDPEENQ